MVLIPIECPHCKSIKISKFGFSGSGEQRYKCKNCNVTFQAEYKYNACDPEISSKVFFMTVNGNGIRAIARTLKIDQGTVIKILRSFEESLWYINYAYLEKLNDKKIDIDIVSENEVEIASICSKMDEMWSFVHDKSQQYWLWWAIDHNTGEPLAFHFGTAEHHNLDELLKLLEPFEIGIVYADNNSAYSSRIEEEKLNA